jgi:hypothetical protein
VAGCSRSRAPATGVETDWKHLDLRGRVERITSTTWRPDTGMETGKLVASGTSTSWFDGQGYLLEQRWLDPRQELSGSVQYGRPSAAGRGGRRERTERGYDADGKLEQRVTVAWDADGRRVEETYYNTAGARTGGYTYEYDGQGRLVRRTMETIYAADDRRTGETVFAFDDEGRNVEERYAEEGLGDSAYRIVYRWKDDRVVRRADYSRGTLLIFLTFYEYDATGNVVREVGYQLPEDGSADRYADAAVERDLPASLRSSVVTTEYRYTEEAR